jgi:hypothetical protein
VLAAMDPSARSSGAVSDVLASAGCVARSVRDVCRRQTSDALGDAPRLVAHQLDSACRGLPPLGATDEHGAARLGGDVRDSMSKSGCANAGFPRS